MIYPIMGDQTDLKDPSTLPRTKIIRETCNMYQIIFDSGIIHIIKTSDFCVQNWQLAA